MKRNYCYAQVSPRGVANEIQYTVACATEAEYLQLCSVADCRVFKIKEGDRDAYQKNMTISATLIIWLKSAYLAGKAEEYVNAVRVVDRQIRQLENAMFGSGQREPC